ncbi:MAG: glycosyltransferase family 4 protein [Acidobacteriota bacterium]
MRILTLANTPLDPASGSGYVILGYAERLRALGHSVELLGPVDFEPFYGARRAIRHRQTLGMAAACLDRLGAGGYDVVEIYGAEGWLAMSLLAATPGRRYLLAIHSNGIETHCSEVLAAAGLTDRTRWRPDPARLSALAFRRADALVTVSDWDAGWASQRGYAPNRRILALDNPLPDRFLDQPLSLDREPEIGYCGAWLPIKGIAALGREIPEVLSAFPDWRFVLVGVGDSFRAEEHFPEDVRPRISVVPRADRETELRALYHRFSIVVAPSVYESFGLATAEAMACGAAVVASPVGFAAGLADGQEVVHLRPDRPLTAAVGRLIRDPDLRHRVATGGWERAQALRWEPAASRLAEAYQSWTAELRRGIRKGSNQ